MYRKQKWLQELLRQNKNSFFTNKTPYAAETAVCGVFGIKARKAVVKEYEIVEHLQLEDMNIFLVELSYRSPHLHKEFEICMVLTGRVIVYANQNACIFEPGDVMIFNPHQSHELRALTERVLLVSIQAASGFCSRVYPSIRRLEFEQMKIDFTGNPQCKSRMQNQMLQLGLLYHKAEETYEFFCMSMLYEMFGILLQTQSWHLISEKEKMERYNKGIRLSRITDYIETHFTEKITLTDIACNENLSMHYLSHFFKEMLGLPFQEYVALLRFERARKLIERTNKSITEICLECGFSDYRYLNKIYQKQMGYTPMEYRRSHKIDPIETKEEILTGTIERYFSPEDSIALLESAAQSSVFVDE